MSDPNITKTDLVRSIRESLGLPPKEKSDTDVKINESYNTQAKKFKLSTELLSNKSKKHHQDLFEKYVDTLNEISAKLDTAPRDDSEANFSEYRSLKIDETYNLNASFLHGLFFENISDVHSQVTMDSMAFMRLERDFGSFDDWQKDFALTQDVGRAFLPAYAPLIEARLQQSWDAADREIQLTHRGLYAEYNLLYDRGTRFGLETGHDPDAVLMSLPPLAKWT